MNPHQRNKVDISAMTPDEQRLFRLYGKLPNRNDLIQKKFQERKYFDSGDYALSKAGKASDAGVTSIGSQHPLPENIPHLTSPAPTVSTNPPGNGAPAAPASRPEQSVSPVKESRFKSEDAGKPAEEQGKLEVEGEKQQQKQKEEEGSGGVSLEDPAQSVKVAE